MTVYHTPVNQLFAVAKSTPQTFTVTAGEPTQIIAKKGTIVRFYSTSFKEANGNLITSGKINIELVEMYTPGEMALNGATAATDQGLLGSGGQIKITATQNGKTVYANKYGLGFLQNGSSSVPMSIYTGSMDNSDSIIRWKIAGTQNHDITVNGTVSGDSSHLITTPGFYYLFDSCTDFNWVNCDHFYALSGPLTDIRVVFPDNTYDEFNTRVFIVFPDINSMDMPKGLYKINDRTMGNLTAAIPVGMNYEIFVLTYKNSDWFYYEQSGVAVNGLTIKAAMTMETLYDIKSRMRAL